MSDQDANGVDRRTVLATGAALLTPAAADAKPSDIVMMDAVGLASAIAARKLSCAEVMTAYLDHIARLNPRVNAIVALSPAVLAAAALTDYAADLTLNVGSITGGTVVNRVPHEASFDLEMRAFDPVALQEAGEKLKALAHPASPGVASIEVLHQGSSPAWPLDDRTQALANHWVSAGATLGCTVKLIRRGGLSDANYLRGLGPTLDGLGPNGANAHCSERSADGTVLPEYVDVPSFVPKAALNALAIVNLVSGKV